MRPKIVVANWKMNKTRSEAISLAQEVVQGLTKSPAAKLPHVILLPPAVYLDSFQTALSVKGLSLGAQNCHEQATGAFTGEISAPMLRSVGAQYVLIGHSERRQYLGETDQMLAKKVDIALAYGLQPIFCCGEPLKARQNNYHLSLVLEQIELGLFHLQDTNMKQVIIAYEPVWAIGTGQTPAPTQIQEMHTAIRKYIGHKYGNNIAIEIPILYGGSCNAENAKSLFSCNDVDGGLIGGASLQLATFMPIIESC